MFVKLGTFPRRVQAPLRVTGYIGVGHMPMMGYACCLKWFFVLFAGKDGVLTMSAPLIRTKQELDIMLNEDFFDAGDWRVGGGGEGEGDSLSHGSLP